mgnify:CR=1 FL=1
MKKTLAIMLALIMALAMIPALAEGKEQIYWAVVDTNGDNTPDKLVISSAPYTLDTTESVKEADKGSFDYDAYFTRSELPWKYENYLGITTAVVMANAADGKKVAPVNSRAWFDQANINGKQQLKSVDLSGLSGERLENMCVMFQSAKQLETVTFPADFNTSHVTDMSYMFNNCSSLKTLNLGNWNTSNVTDMQWMFAWTGLTSITGLANWDTSNVTTMQFMFNHSEKLAKIDSVANWDTSNVTDMCGTFNNCRALESVDVSKWDTSKVTTMQQLFDYCYTLNGIDVSKWNTSNVTNMDRVFQKCNGVTTLDLSGWDTSKVTNMNGMFGHINGAMKSIDISSWDTSKVTNMNYMFAYSTSLEEVKGLDKIDTSNVTTMQGMFYQTWNLVNIDVSHFDTSKVTTVSGMFAGDSWNPEFSKHPKDLKLFSKVNPDTNVDNFVSVPLVDGKIVSVDAEGNVIMSAPSAVIIEVATAEELVNAVNNAAPGSSTVIRLKNDIELTDTLTIPVGKDITIDLNRGDRQGMKLTGNIVNNGKLTIIDTTPVTSSYFRRGDGTVVGNITNANGAALTLQNMNVNGNGKQALTNNGGTVTLSNVNIFNTREDASVKSEGGDMMVKGGTIIGPQVKGGSANEPVGTYGKDSTAISAEGNAKVTIVGFDTTNSGKIIENEGAQVILPSGKVLHEGRIVDAVAEVSGVQYGSVEAAITAANGAPVKLLKDNLEPEIKSNALIDLNGKTLENVEISGDATLRIMGSGTCGFDPTQYLVNNHAAEKTGEKSWKVSPTEITPDHGTTDGGSSGGGYYHPDPTPVPVIVIPPKTGDMTIWQSILHFFGIR